MGFDPQLVVDPFTLAVVLVILAWVQRLDKRVAVIENTQAYNRGLKQGREEAKEVNK